MNAHDRETLDWVNDAAREYGNNAWASELLGRVRAVMVARDNAEAALAEIGELRSCLGAGPMDYEAFTDEIERVIGWKHA
jgi:hypothetical protein